MFFVARVNFHWTLNPYGREAAKVSYGTGFQLSELVFRHWETLKQSNLWCLLIGPKILKNCRPWYLPANNPHGAILWWEVPKQETRNVSEWEGAGILKSKSASCLYILLSTSTFLKFLFIFQIKAKTPPQITKAKMKFQRLICVSYRQQISADSPPAHNELRFLCRVHRVLNFHEKLPYSKNQNGTVGDKEKIYEIPHPRVK